MLSNFRPYCPLLVYLLIISYGELIFQQPLFNSISSIAQVASVQNAHHDFFMNKTEEHGEHIHIQEVAAQKITWIHFLVDTEEEQHEEQNMEVPQEDLKIKQDFVLKDSSDTWSHQCNFRPPSSYLSFISTLPTPPPRA